MKKCYALFLFVMAITYLHTKAQVNLSAPNGSYTQDFNTLALSANSTTLPAGWLFNETGTSANATYTAGTGSSNTGDTYSFGAAASTDRAFGSVQSGSLTSTIGVSFTNNTGATISAITVAYTGEQWRFGATGRADRLDFQYSLNATSLTTGTWTDENNLDFSSPNTTAAVGSLDGNAAGNRTAILFTISGINIPAGGTFFLRWNDFNASGADDGLTVDDLTINYTNSGGGSDVTPPAVSTLSPANNTTGVSTTPALIITFTENIQAGTGNIAIKKTSDNSTVQTIDVATAAVTVAANTASFNATLAPNTTYYIQADAGTFKDLANNSFAGITAVTDWQFTTQAPPGAGTLGATYNFNTCSSFVTDGFRQYSVTGPEIWACTKFGRTYTTDPSTDSALQISGFTGVAHDNEDWFISPRFDLSGTDVPLLRFYSRTKFAGNALVLKVSTDYNGTGSPQSAIWTTINGKLPATDTDVWTLSDSINLSAFKSNNVYIAWVYTSNTSAAARWTLDDVSVFNSTVQPGPDLSLNPVVIDFGFAANGTQSAWKAIAFTGSDFSSPVTLSVNANFAISKDSTVPGTNISYTAAEVNAGDTFYVRFAPLAAYQNFTSPITATSGSYTKQVATLKGSSLSSDNTLDVVNWNIEWFGSTAQAPNNDDLQEANVKTILRNLNADIYGLSEIVDTMRLRRVVDSLGNTEYGFVIADYCSYAPVSTDPDYATGQKNGFIYRKSLFSNITTRGLLRYHAVQTQTDSASYWWSSGRFPFLMNADVTVNGVTKNINFIVIHAKANTGTNDEKLEAYRRRTKAIKELKDTLDANFSTANILLFGDFNDDFDRTIAPIASGPDTVSSYTYLVSDSTDGNSYRALTLALSLQGLRSTATNTEVIDHVVASNEMNSYYLANAATIRSDVANLVTSYSSTTTDHYPVLTRFNLLQAQGPLPVKLSYFTGRAVGQQVALQWATAQEANSKEFVIERSADGRIFTAVGITAAAGNADRTTTYNWVDNHPLQGVNFYQLKQVDIDGKSIRSAIVKVVISNSLVYTLSPNPAHTFVTLALQNNTKPVTIQLTTLSGQLLQQKTVAPATATVSLPLQGVAKGIYLLKIVSNTVIQTEKLVIE